MHVEEAYVNLPILIALLAATIGAAAAAAIVTQGPGVRANQLAGLLLTGVAWWAMGDVLRLLAPDASWALRAAELSTPGWIFMGPLALHLASVMRAPAGAWTRPLVPWSYALFGAFLAGAWLAPGWMFEKVIREPDGWVVVPGPGVIVVMLATLVHVVPVAAYGIRVFRRSPSASDQARLRWLTAGLALPIVTIPTFNVILPMLGQPSVRLGSLALATFGAVVAWTAHRHGTSPLGRGGLARQIVDAHPDGVALVFPSGEIGSASEGLARLTGRPTWLLEGRSLDGLLDPPLEEPQREASCVEGHLCREDGERIPVSVDTRPLADRRGLDLGCVVVIRDLREVADLRSQLVTSGRLASMGQLAAGIAHEINNPMAFVRTNLTLLREHWQRMEKEPPPAERENLLSEADELLEESLEGVERACAIVRDVNAFSHAGTGEREPVELAELLENVLRVASPHLHRGVRVVRRFRTIPPADGAPQELKQVFLNLLLNAAQALGELGTITVETAAESNAVVVRVCDDGCGIPEADREKVFDPFFTTKPVGEGTGMGLFISYQIVRNHGGEFTIESAPGQGTRVSVRLPIHSG
jgi:signal transduction histidine kinase